MDVCYEGVILHHSLMNGLKLTLLRNTAFKGDSMGFTVPPYFKVIPFDIFRIQEWVQVNDISATHLYYKWVLLTNLAIVNTGVKENLNDLFSCILPRQYLKYWFILTIRSTSCLIQFFLAIRIHTAQILCKVAYTCSLSSHCKTKVVVSTKRYVVGLHLYGWCSHIHHLNTDTE